MSSKTAVNAKGLRDSMEKLSMNGRENKKPAPPESWDEEADSPADSSSKSSSGPSTPIADSTPGPPPPTPISPRVASGRNADWAPLSPPTTNDGLSYSNRSSTERLEKRPEKSNAVAGRLIAGALGVKTPKMTDEQRQYEKAIREKERKRVESDRERRKREELDREAAKKAIWDD